jgi:hypothetical protein
LQFVVRVRDDKKIWTSVIEQTRLIVDGHPPRAGRVCHHPLFSFSLPIARQKFMLDASDFSVTATAVLIGLLAAVLIEASWWVQGRVLGEPRVLWR